MSPNQEKIHRNTCDWNISNFVLTDIKRLLSQLTKAALIIDRLARSKTPGTWSVFYDIATLTYLIS